MKLHKAENNDDIIESIVTMLEKETGNKIFTIKVLNDKEDEQEFLDAIVVFEDKAVLRAEIHVMDVDGKMGIRMKGNYL